MKLSDFDYQLPAELIAYEPLTERSSSRLLVVDEATETFTDKHFYELSQFLKTGDLLVFNNTKVIPARLYGQKASGGKLEVLIERVQTPQQALAHIRASKAPKAGTLLELEASFQATVLGREGELFKLTISPEQNWFELLDKHGHIPLPPYIERPDLASDRERYQTVYAQKLGAVAAPTAGLHFDEALLTKLAVQGIETTTVTLHVGAGTFQPVRTENLSQHRMHAEYVDVSQEACDSIQACKARGGRVVAVGTTSVRSLETAAQTGKIQPYTGDTRLFIQLGYEFKVVDLLITNFHLPQSTLLILVSAFAGYKTIKQAYQHAIKQNYRFFSYGDAMLLTRRKTSRLTV
ncbi:tRNA preQ1(34) S-adenosylmethionine ribosyltransferase-isomerase QueA [uncultured Thiothrix sp.]|uniref:tRNA preQ1(34) S-adenosylmethionine ribosyltransferase-isomerase QueA n=1 Tax=uncultured Thiothrix sp. TaxID=223185 RepID=UPI002606FFC5|nr:tRNA preQ1(34) S-adenosylmethionine ribosyltransferase-isomerase QueA [uncultured Thiothrix sp.]HMT92931.1 tRNA preQ1(34) S-adenosylmethionine ribosyltransferase-isomerase QueA [Thiolinea sp.]